MQILNIPITKWTGRLVLRCLKMWPKAIFVFDAKSGAKSQEKMDYVAMCAMYFFANSAHGILQMEQPNPIENVRSFTLLFRPEKM